MFLPLLGACGTDASAQGGPPAATTTEPDGHYCDLRGFTPAQRKQLGERMHKASAAITGTKELPNGYELTFPSTFREAGEWIDGVRRCCPTVDIEIRFASRGGATVVRMSGGPGAKDFLREELAPLFKAP